MQDLINRLDILVGRGVQDNDDGANEADGTAQLAQRAQLLVEEVRAQHGANQDAEGAQRRHQDGRGKGVGGKVADFADANWEEEENKRLECAYDEVRWMASVLTGCNACPPHGALEIYESIALESVPLFGL